MLTAFLSKSQADARKKADEQRDKALKKAERARQKAEKERDEEREVADAERKRVEKERDEQRVAADEEHKRANKALKKAERARHEEREAADAERKRVEKRANKALKKAERARQKAEKERDEQREVADNAQQELEKVKLDFPVALPHQVQGFVFEIDHFICFTFFEELLDKAITFVRDELNKIPFLSKSPFLLASHASTGGRLDRDKAIFQMNTIVFERLKSFKNGARSPSVIGTDLRFPIPVTVSGPGGGKSLFLDEWLSLKDADVNKFLRLPDSGLFLQALRSCIRLPVSLNDRTPLLFSDGELDNPLSHDAEASVSLRALFAYVLPSECFSRENWLAFHRYVIPIVPPSLPIELMIQCIVKHHDERNKNTLLFPTLVLFGMDEILKVEAGRQEVILSKLGMLQEDQNGFIFIPLVTSLSQTEMETRVQTVSGRPLHDIDIPPISVSSAPSFFNQDDLERDPHFRLLMYECAGVPRHLEFLQAAIKSRHHLSAVVSEWLRRSFTYTGFFQKFSHEVILDILRVSLVPPFRVACPETLIGLDQFHVLTKIGLFTSSKIPQLTGVQLRAFAIQFASETSVPVLQLAAQTLARVYSNFHRVNYLNFEQLVCNREILIRCLSLQVISFKDRYMFPHVGQWFNAEELRKLKFARVEYTSQAQEDEVLDYRIDASLDLDMASFHAPLVCEFKANQKGIDLLTMDKLTDDRDLILLMQVKFTDAVDGKSRLQKLTSVISKLRKCVTEVQGQFPSAVVAALLLTNRVSTDHNIREVEEAMIGQSFPLGVLDRQALVNIYGPTLTLHPAFSASADFHLKFAKLAAVENDKDYENEDDEESKVEEQPKKKVKTASVVSAVAAFGDRGFGQRGRGGLVGDSSRGRGVFERKDGIKKFLGTKILFDD